MSGTKSPSRKAQVIKKNVIIVAHGQPSRPKPAEAMLASLAKKIRPFLPDWNIMSATLAAPDSLETTLEISGQKPFIYPVFMTDGWFIQSALPGRVGETPSKILPPLGADPGLPALAASIIDENLKKRDWDASETRLLIASHGSGRSPNSARATENFTQALSRLITFAEIRIGYIEQEPELCEAAKNMGEQTLCLPFFAASGDHILEDLPEALDEAGFTGVRMAPLGNATDIPALIANALQEAARD